MSTPEFAKIIEESWEQREHLSSKTQGSARVAVEAALDGLDRGEYRIAEKGAEGWVVNQWLKKAVLLSFRLNDSHPLAGGYDKVPLKFTGWGDKEFAAAGFRAVPGAVVRRSAYIAPGVVLMPSFVNVGAHVAKGTMIDTWATVGSCAQIGAHCHISGGAGIGGVLEPLQAEPVVIEDDCLMGVFLGKSTKIVDRATGDVTYGRVPAYSVVVPGSLPGKPLADGTMGPSLACAVIVKRVDAKTRSSTSINALLRD
jgi:2,3,4,5-tetrahydropyridine-2-carboxylate N-succinyltransferase